MKLVLTNDDGIDAPGLEALRRACKSLGEPVVVAPAEPQSGVGHKLTTKEPIAVQELGPTLFGVKGTPADCARVALRAIAADAGWLLAGINRGGNLGVDVYTSGTVAAAREAALLGYPAIAVSQYVGREREVDWNLTELRARWVIRLLMERPVERGSFWNVNLPHPTGGETDLDIVFCPLDPSPHDVRYHQVGEHMIYQGDYHSRQRLPGRDIDVCLGGKIAITAIHLDQDR